ncbi:hypothetical protein AB4254_13635 [Vibrio breoganii]
MKKLLLSTNLCPAAFSMTRTAINDLAQGDEKALLVSTIEPNLIRQIRTFINSEYEESIFIEQTQSTPLTEQLKAKNNINNNDEIPSHVSDLQLILISKK